MATLASSACASWLRSVGAVRTEVSRDRQQRQCKSQAASASLDLQRRSRSSRPHAVWSPSPDSFNWLQTSASNTVACAKACRTEAAAPKMLETAVQRLSSTVVLGLVLFNLVCGASAAELDPLIQLQPPIENAGETYERAPARRDIPMFDTSERRSVDEAEQVHVSMAGKGAFRVSWATRNREAPSFVEYGLEAGNYPWKSKGESSDYSFYIVYRSPAIHHAVLGAEEPLKPDTTYHYRIGGTGQDFSFKTPPPPAVDVPVNFAVVGDLGQTLWSVTTLEHISQMDHHMLLLAGDLSYADLFQPRWDSWGRLIEPEASRRPWMTTAGNHEIEDAAPLEPLFKAYNTRWRMPHEESGSPSNLFYSFEVGNAHVLMLGSYAEAGPGSPQYVWLQNDLAKVDRSKTPWLVVVLHAPWYNSNEAHQHEADEMMGALEDTLYKARADVVFSGHVHAYERWERMYKGVPDPCGIVHITIGDGGNREGLATKYLEPKPEGSIYREASFGHGQFRILNATTASWEWHRNQDDVDVVADTMHFAAHAHEKTKCPPLS